MSDDCRTLIVDDDVDMAFLVSTAIEVANHGLTVAGVAYSGAEALRQFPEAKPHIVVLDSRMPERDGLDVAADIFAIAPTQKIVMFSAYLDAETIARAKELGIRECVGKQQIHDLPDILRKHCAAV
jgi:DNA-binding NarL/FixJ family response regulator